MHAQDSPLPSLKMVSADTPLFVDPIKFVWVYQESASPFMWHNHDPALVACPNGDVLATWFSTIEETGRESAIVQVSLSLFIEYSFLMELIRLMCHRHL